MPGSTTTSKPAGRGALASNAQHARRLATRAAEASVMAAFTAVVDRQARNGRLSRRTEDAIAHAVRSVRTTNSKKRARMTSSAVRAIVDQFHCLFYNDRGTWRRNTWQGSKTWKSPNDLWLYQEIIHNLRPGLIIETGTAFGGSATYLGWLLDIEGRGEVVSVDISARATPPHPRVTYLSGSSTDPAIVDKVKGMVPAGEPVIVILDSDHSERHVYDELQAYADLVTPGSYLIVEDTNVNGHPAFRSHGPGPMEAARRFVAERPDFVVDTSMHRLLLSLNPHGYLRRL